MKYAHYFTFLFSCIVLIQWTDCMSHSYRKECPGTPNDRNILSTSGSDEDRYESLRKMYTNCTHVLQNLVIVHFVDENLDFSFLKDIREVFGSVVIVSNYVSTIPLRSLIIIRGVPLYKPEDGDRSYSLYVATNSLSTSQGEMADKKGLRELQLNSLQEISAGDVLFRNNRLLCFDKTIYWSYILPTTPVFIEFPEYEKAYECTAKKCSVECERTIENSIRSFCWGEGSDMCQTLTSLNCSSDCESGTRCFGSENYQCCSNECAGGCTGRSAFECLACAEYEDNGKCASACPLRQIRNRETRKLEPNPNFKYRKNRECVKDCGEMKAQGDECVNHCDSNHTESGSRVCLPCNGVCPQKVQCEMASGEYIHAGNIERFRNCTHLLGAVKLIKPSFKGHMAANITGITRDQLQLFETLEEISDFLHINDVEEITSLSFFKRLRVINGQKLYKVESSTNEWGLYIYQTSLEYLGLTALKEIRKGNIHIQGNPRLCFAEPGNSTAFMTSLFPDKTLRQGRVIKDNSNSATCAANNQLCSDQCAPIGCWGPNDDKCWSCKNFRFENRCLASCELEQTDQALYEFINTEDVSACKRCHKECLDGCTGDGPYNCSRCRNFKNPINNQCVETCPSNMYPDQDGKCQLCYKDCGSEGCTGPGMHLGVGGCKWCALTLARGNGTLDCLPLNLNDCEKGFYGMPETAPDIVDQETTKKVRVCRPCDPECRTCYGRTNAECDVHTACMNFREEQKCVSNCSINFYYDNGPNKTCRDCAEAGEALSKGEICVGSPAVIALMAQVEAVEAMAHRNRVIITTVVVCGLLLGAAGLVIFLGVRYNRRQKQILQITEEIPMVKSDAEPDLSSLRLINESELKRGNSIGSGAFGTVYKGVWFPPAENVKIPVAIKVLTNEANTNQNKELLDEARIMASVHHPHCIRIIAVCMTAPMQLITPLMACGALLDYIRKQKNNIGSKSLLNWSVQIAKGMEYLEQRGIVHRDLAARNVLVQTPNWLRITDFGLAKLLEYQEEAFHSSGGKMPIKWLALECIEHRIYTHKSDVWSYGVTLWEMFTYGQKPFADINARDMPAALERGHRLSQPDICTIDVYMMMIKCWTLDAMSRPSFTELVFEFTRMAADPGRYIVIQGDTLMRLHSVVPNSTELIRGMSGIDLPEGPETCMSADDYLSPADVRMSRPFQHLISITEENGYHDRNSSEEAQCCADSNDHPLRELNRRESGQRYIADPSDERLLKPLLSPVHYTGKKAPKTDESGYLEPGNLSGIVESADYLEVHGSVSDIITDAREGENSDTQYLNVTTNGAEAVGNPGYYFETSADDERSTVDHNSANSFRLPPPPNKLN